MSIKERHLYHKTSEQHEFIVKTLPYHEHAITIKQFGFYRSVIEITLVYRGHSIITFLIEPFKFRPKQVSTIVAVKQSWFSFAFCDRVSQYK